MPKYPTTPISDLDARLRKLIPLVRAAETRSCAEKGGPNEKAADADLDALWARLAKLVNEVYRKPVTSWADVQAIGTLAAYWHDPEGDGSIEGLDEDSPDHIAAAHLIKAVLAVGGRTRV